MKIYIIGTGVMGSAIARALAKKGERVFVYDKNFDKVKALAKDKNITAEGSLENLNSADFIILAVKPYHIVHLSLGAIKRSAVIMSIAAGVKISSLQKAFRHSKILRVMPNLGVSVGHGVAVWKSFGLSATEKAKVKKLLGQFTEHFEARKETEIDAFTAIAGSGPAYFFSFAQGLQKAARVLGFSTQTSRLLAQKTFTAAEALQKNHEYQDLIGQVASKKGTTEAALKVFSKSRLDKIVLKAVKAAQTRAKEISNE